MTTEYAVCFLEGDGSLITILCATKAIANACAVIAKVDAI